MFDEENLISPAIFALFLSRNFRIFYSPSERNAKMKRNGCEKIFSRNDFSFSLQETLMKGHFKLRFKSLK